MASKRAALCVCGHQRTAHNEARRGLPNYCGVCRGAKALHKFEEAVNGIRS